MVKQRFKIIIGKIHEEIIFDANILKQNQVRSVDFY